MTVERRALLLAPVFLLVLILFSISASAQRGKPPPNQAGAPPRSLEAALPPAVEAAIDQLAARVEANRTTFAQIVARHGFPPADWQGEQWRNIGRMPPQELLEYAWRSAEKANPDRGGAQLLGNVIADMAESNTAIKTDEILSTYRRTQGQIKFDLLAQPDFNRPLPEHVERVVERLGRYVEPHNLRGYIRRCCGLSESQAKRTMRSSGDLRAALRQALREGTIPPELAKRLAILLESIVAANPAMAFDGDLARFREPLLDLYRASNPAQGSVAVSDAEAALSQLARRIEDDVPELLKAARGAANVTLEQMAAGRDVVQLAEEPQRVRRALQETAESPFLGSAPQSSTGGGGGGGGGLPHTAARNKAFDIMHSAESLGPRPGARQSFKVVSRGGGGRGGVVFGNAVSADPKLSAPLTASWAPLDSSGASGAEHAGAFRFRLADGRIVFSPPISRGDATAIVRIVFVGLPGITDAFSKDEAIGLAGFTGRFVTPRIENGRLTTAESNRGLSFVVDPMIADTPIGAAAIVTDAMLIDDAEKVLISVLDRSGIAKKEREEFDAWRDAAHDLTGGIVPVATYKFTDIPMTVREGTDQILRAVPEQGWPSDLHIRLNRFKGINADSPIDENPGVAAAALQTLKRACAEVARLDRFAEVLAVLRWSRGVGAVWVGGLDPSVSGVVHTALVVDDKQLRTFPSAEVFASKLVDELHNAALQSLAQAPAALKDMETRVYEIRKQLININAAKSLVSEAAFASAPEKRREYNLSLQKLEEGERRALIALIRKDPELSKKRREVEKLSAEADEKLGQLNAAIEASAERRTLAALEAAEKRLREEDASRQPPPQLLQALRPKLPAVLQKALSAAEQAKRPLEAVVPGFSEWHRLHSEFHAACPSGACSAIVP